MEQQFMEKVVRALKELAKRYPVFHSEEEFQNLFGKALLMLYPDCQFKLSKRADIGLGYPKSKYDLWVEMEGQKFLINLKYVTSSINYKDHHLLDQGFEPAQIFDYLKDLERLEKMKQEGFFGFNIFLTNCPDYWVKPTETLTLVQSKEIEKKIYWNNNYLRLQKDYFCAWVDYSKISGGGGNNIFKYLLLKAF
jgi:hypothetical protein